MIIKPLKYFLLIAALGMCYLIIRKRESNPSYIEQPIVEKYGRAFNFVRREKNIPIIEQGWIVHWLDTTYAYWSNKGNHVNTHSPMHLSKSVYFAGDSLATEEDIFHFEGAPEFAFKLEATYNFHTDSAQFRLIKYFKKVTYPPSESINISYELADSVFRAWGFKDNFYFRPKNNQ